MSYIDTFPHEFIGYFGAIPVYHPLIAHEGVLDGGDQFGCTPDHLVIGGGGGEHPAIVVRDPSYTVAIFLWQWLLWCEDNAPKLYAEHEQVFDRWGEILLHDIPEKEWPEVFNFAGWTVKDYAMFAEECSSAAFLTPFSPERERSAFIETWLAASIGEFVFFSMPELAGRTVARFERPRDYVKLSCYRNVVLPPPGYPDYYGRGSSDGVLTWGNLAWNISRAGR